MLDRKLLRDNPDEVKAALARRGQSFVGLLHQFLALDYKRRELKEKLDLARSKKKAVSRDLGTQISEWEKNSAEMTKLRERLTMFKKKLLVSQSEKKQSERLAFTGQHPTKDYVDEIDFYSKIVKDISDQIEAARKTVVDNLKGQQEDLLKAYSLDIGDLEKEFTALETQQEQTWLELPNLPHASIPTGGEEAAVIVKDSPIAPRVFDFTPRDHVEICSHLQLVNFEAGARLTGGGFPVMHGMGARLQRAVINLMLDVHIDKHGYTELRPPFIVHPRCPLGTGQLPKFGGEMYHVYVAEDGAVATGVTPAVPDAPTGETPVATEKSGPDFYLIPTAEVPVVNYYREQILDAPRLPIKLCAYSPCWRVEAGSYGKEARGLTRLHQFEKVELVRIADPAHSWEDLEEMTAEAEAILELLGLAYRRKLLPSGDMAFGSAKTYDLEVFCPAEGVWREVSSASNTTDWQARRAGIRFRRERGGKPEFPHLLNASGLALPRLIIALLETYQQADGGVDVPAPLLPYLGGAARITPPDGSVPLI